MFSEWLEKQEDASWDQLLKAFRSPSVQLKDLAKEIETQLLDGKFRCEVLVLNNYKVAIKYRMA